MITPNKPKVSVIIPIYNAQKTLQRCFNSWASQTLTNFEVLLINDGSSDNSPRICDAMVTKDRRFKVIHKDNAGVAAARQTGLDLVEGEYTIQADADDWVDANWLEALVHVADKEKADVVFGDIVQEFKEYQLIKPQKPSGVSPLEVIKEMCYQTLHGGPWNKLIRASIIKNHKVKFISDINFGEDTLYITQCLLYANSIAYQNKACYHYDCYSSENSICRTFTLEKLHTLMKFKDKFVELTNLDDNSEVIGCWKAMIKIEAFTHGLLSNSEIKALYPGVKQSPYFKSHHFPNWYIYNWAINGHQHSARLFFTLRSWIKQLYLIFYSQKS